LPGPHSYIINTIKQQSKKYSVDFTAKIYFSHLLCLWTVEHALSCPQGGFPSLQHNEVHDLTARMMTEVCNNVEVEPHLQPLSGESLSLRTANSDPGAQLEIAAG